MNVETTLKAVREGDPVAELCAVILDGCNADFNFYLLYETVNDSAGTFTLSPL